MDAGCRLKSFAGVSQAIKPTVNRIMERMKLRVIFPCHGRDAGECFAQDLNY